MSPRRLRLAHLPTPLWHSESLDRLVGCELWVKRDDMTAGAAAGNKIRKLEFLLADAVSRRADTVITCGGEQSNHARATALAARGLGLDTRLLLRTATGVGPTRDEGNLLLDRLAGASIRFIDPPAYAERARLLEAEAAELRTAGKQPYVIPEGGSNAIGSLGYVEAMREIREQLDLGLAQGREPFDVVVHACGSGGTAAGVCAGALHFGVAPQVWAMAVCDSRDYFERVVGRILLGIAALRPELGNPAELVVSDRDKGPAYAVASDAQKQFIRDVLRATGLVLDPVYTGKALFALSRMEPKPRRALFLHTGGLPGLLAQHDAFSS
ncbi:MAG: D-cysteine desulfhydrase family protein [Polyangiaceae bacterium]